MSGFIPAGWKLIKSAEGDLNKDGLPDVAGVLEEQPETPPSPADDGSSRVLFIALAKAGGGYRLSVQSNKAILRSGQGGAFGDPFDHISVDRGSLFLRFYGGSSERWSYDYQFRLQNGGWFLIGVTTQVSNTNTDEGASEDFNLLTGKMISTTTDARGKTLKKTSNRGKRKLVNLSSFDAEADEQPF